MAWDQKKLPDAMATAATAAAAAVGNGSKNAAYLTYIQGQIGSGYKRKLKRNDVDVWEATASGTLPISGSSFVLPLVATQNSISAADIDTGEWVHYIEKASDATKYIATGVTKTGGVGPAYLTADLESAQGVVLGSFVLDSPAFDTVTTTPTTLAEAYATAMTSFNDFSPGNSAGSSDWVNSTWPSSTDFSTSPYGSNIDPIRSGQSEPGVGVTDAGYIVTRRAASGRSGTGAILWAWVMPPKGSLNTAGNWRVQIRDFKAAVKIDALSNPWQLFYGPAQVPSYGNNNLGGLRVSGIFADYTNSSSVVLFDQNANPAEARNESSGGVSFKNMGTTLAHCLMELNAPDPAATLPSGATPARTVAFAGVYWARLIPDTGAGPVPSGVNIGAMLGVDFYDASGRVGTPGQSRLVRLTEAWKPVVVAFVLPSSPPATPMSPAQVGAWLPANPPPF